jgi:hypothetical protein
MERSRVDAAGRISTCAYLRPSRRGDQHRRLIVAEPQRLGQGTQRFSVRPASSPSLQRCHCRRGETRPLRERRLAQPRLQAKRAGTRRARRVCPDYQCHDGGSRPRERFQTRLLTIFRPFDAAKYLRNEVLQDQRLWQNAVDIEFLGADGAGPRATRQDDCRRGTAEFADLVTLIRTQPRLAGSPEVGDHNRPSRGIQRLTKRGIRVARSHLKALTNQKLDEERR